MRYRFALVLVLGLLLASAFGQQSTGVSPANDQNASLEQHIRDLEDRIIALEGQVRMLKAAAQPTVAPAAPGQPPESGPQAQAAAVSQPAPALTPAGPQAAGIVAGQEPSLGGAGGSAAKALNPDIVSSVILSVRLAATRSRTRSLSSPSLRSRCTSRKSASSRLSIPMLGATSLSPLERKG